MDKIVEFLLYGTFLYVILKRYNKMFILPLTCLFLAIFLYNILLYIAKSVYYKKAIKYMSLYDSIIKSFCILAIYVIISEIMGKNLQNI